MADNSIPLRDKVRLVKERLAAVRYPTIKSLTEPAAITAARKRVDDFDKKDSDYRQAQRNAHKAKIEAVRELLIFGDADKALVALKKLEAESHRG